jgi:hypothetical protein
MYFDPRLMKAFVVAVMLVSSACSMKQDGSTDPKARLNEYISQSFAVKKAADRKELASYLTGEARRRLEGWSDDQFVHAFVDSKREFVKLAFKEVKNVSASEVGVTYEVVYLANGAKVTNKKLAQMIQENGKWVISAVHNIKELVEYKNEMSLP